MTLLHMLAFLAAIIPVHGTVLGPGANGTLIIRNDPVTKMVPARTRAYRVTPKLHVTPGVGIDGFLDRSVTPWRWYDAAIAAKFTPGLPEPDRVIPFDYGSHMPHTILIDQLGRPVDLASSFPGKVELISFVFTRCPDKDECPTVSNKFKYLQDHLDPNKFHLAIISLDPVYDSPAVLRAYGKQFGADPQRWSLLTGQPQQIQNLLNRFGISSMRVSDANFIHNDRVFLVNQEGAVADIVDTVGFAPDSMISEAKHTAGLVSSPLGRLELSLVASVVALCGGSQYSGVVLMETILFFVIAIASFAVLAWVARKMWVPPSP
ncbi:MAG TPA: SCO family protein [Candidatus Baltobacteraceae bacterium]|jgi:protein SCO1/2